jgi:hypothetical protein
MYIWTCGIMYILNKCFNCAVIMYTLTAVIVRNSSIHLDSKIHTYLDFDINNERYGFQLLRLLLT